MDAEATRVIVEAIMNSNTALVSSYAAKAVYGWVGVIATFIFSLTTAGLALLCYTTLKKEGKEKVPEDGKIMFCFAGVIMGVLFTFALVASGVSEIGSVLSNIAAPEAYAIETVLDKIYK